MSYTCSIRGVAGSGSAVDPAWDPETGPVEELLALEAEQRRLDARRARVLATLEGSGETDRRFGHPTGRWWAAEGNLPVASCTRTVTVAVKVSGLMPWLLDALAVGTVSWDHVTVLAEAANERIAERFVTEVPALVGLVGSMTFRAWRREVARAATRLDADGGYDPARDTARSRVFADSTPDGLLLRGLLCGEAGIAFKGALDSEIDALRLRYMGDREVCPDLVVPTTAQLRAQALVNLVRKGLATDLASTRPPRVEVTLTLDAADPDHVLTDDGTLVPLAQLSALLADPWWRPTPLDPHGVPLPTYEGRLHRFFNRAQRRHLAARDGGCVFPGCDTPVSWTDAHHVEPVSEGGVSETCNGALLCRHHHGVTHRNGWTMSATPDQWFHWTTPDGTVISSQRHGRQRAGPP